MLNFTAGTPLNQKTGLTHSLIVGSHHKALLAEDSKIEQHNKKLQQSKRSFATATTRIQKHTTALANPAITPTGFQRHLKGLKASTAAQTKAHAKFDTITAAGRDLAGTGSGKVVLDE
jgi:hypothetical protein